MSATIEIREFPKGLTIRVTESRRVGRILLTLAAGSVFMYFLVHASSSSKLFLIFIGGLCLLSLVRDIISALRGTDVELRVTNLDFISMGHAPGDYKPSTISRADIYNLEFREATGGGDSQTYPKGYMLNIMAADLGTLALVSCPTSIEPRPSRLSKASTAVSRTQVRFHQAAPLSPTSLHSVSASPGEANAAALH